MTNKLALNQSLQQSESKINIELLYTVLLSTSRKQGNVKKIFF